MEQKIKAFAYLKEQLGEVLTMDLPATVTAKDILEKVALDYPQLAGEIKLSQVALRQCFMVEDQVYTLAANEEIALIPPVSGG